MAVSGRSRRVHNRYYVKQQARDGESLTRPALVQIGGPPGPHAFVLISVACKSCNEPTP